VEMDVPVALEPLVMLRLTVQHSRG
jgi:hypothetical protein